jgi:putative acetyltransferase
MYPSVIRPEAVEDWHAIRSVHRQAFDREDEGRLVDLLRDGGYARLSLVAERAGEIVGHVLFSELSIISSGGPVSALALAPLAVTPNHQRRGVGSQLVREGLIRCGQSGHRIVIVLGHAGYYPRFGFSAQLAARLRSPYAGPNFMAVELDSGALDGVIGDVQYPPPFHML